MSNADVSTRWSCVGRLAILFVLAITGTLACAGGARALDIEFSGRSVKRDILAVYDSRHEPLPRDTRVHKFAEMVLNHIGYRVIYTDVNQPLPAPADMARFRGIVSWLIEPMSSPGRYLDWLDSATASDIKLAFFSELAPSEPRTHSAVARRILARLGLDRTEQYITVGSGATITYSNPEMIGFERPVDKVLPDFPLFVPLGDRARVHLAASAPTRSGVKTAALVSTNAAGGYVCDEFSTYFEPNTDKIRWIINPFAFFKEAFGEDRFPVPDVTTLSGRRIYFSHIDGDGWNNLTEIEQFRAQRLTSSEVIAREAIEPYPDLPVTVGLIAGDVDARIGGDPAQAVTARRLFALPQVEVGSHTYTHPFDWSFFEKYDRAAELAKITASLRPAQPLLERVRGALNGLTGRATRQTAGNPYIAGSSDLPRTYLQLPFNVEHEVGGALAVSESFAPAGKKAKLYMWSGDTTPFEGAIAATRAAGARNINGGDSRLDAEYPSIFYVPPISRPVGKERQIYAVNSNENTYTNDWTGPYYGFFMLEHTLKNTESPRRLKPFNLYYHMYSGEKPAALASIKHFLGLARKSDVAPIEASHYAAIADDYFGVEIRQVDLFAWSVNTRGALQTVRFDAAGNIAIDLPRSRGVLGSTRHGDALYVTLDESVERAVVAIKPVDAASSSGEHDQELALEQSRWRLWGRVEEGCGLQIKAQGYGPGDMAWRAPAGRRYKVRSTVGEFLVTEELVQSDKSGMLRLRLADAGNKQVSLRFQCHD